MASTELLADRDIAERYSLAISRMRETTSTRTSNRHVTRPKRSLSTGSLKKKINESLPTKSLATKSDVGKRVIVSGLLAASAYVAWRYFSDFSTSTASK